MRTRLLPGTDLHLSVVGMGCWTIGGEYWGTVDDSVSIRAVRAAVEAGITWFDTAPLYGAGHADDILAKALGSHIDNVIIASKVGVRQDGVGPNGHDGHAHSDLRPEHILADTQASLRRLKRPIDLMQLHWPCEFGTPIEETAEAMRQLQSRGWIRHWGVCNETADDLPTWHAAGAISLQTPYSLLRREFESALRPAAGSIGVLAYEALCRGLLTGRFRTLPHFEEDDLRSRDDRFKLPIFGHAHRIANDLKAIGKKVGCSAAAVALGWVAGQPGITAVIAGCRSPEQVRANIRGAKVAESPALVEVISRAVNRHGPPPHP